MKRILLILFLLAATMFAAGPANATDFYGVRGFRAPLVAPFARPQFNRNLQLQILRNQQFQLQQAQLRALQAQQLRALQFNSLYGANRLRALQLNSGFGCGF